MVPRPAHWPPLPLPSSLPVCPPRKSPINVPLTCPRLRAGYDLADLIPVSFLDHVRPVESPCKARSSVRLAQSFISTASNAWCAASLLNSGQPISLLIVRQQDCGDVVASKFFPIEGPDGKQYPLCERDYFRRLNLICAKCGMALRGSYITACSESHNYFLGLVFPTNTFFRQEVSCRTFYMFPLSHSVWTPGLLLRA
jgi:hypothetical protein